MKLASAILLLGLAAAADTPVYAAAKSTPKPVPVVATYFSNPAPRVGQDETVTTQFYLYRSSPKRFQYIAGAHLSAIIEVGKRILITVQGTATNKQGKATAHFIVPKQTRGKWMWVYTRLTYKGKLYQGSNRVKVAR